MWSALGFEQVFTEYLEVWVILASEKELMRAETSGETGGEIPVSSRWGMGGMLPGRLAGCGAEATSVPRDLQKSWLPACVYVLRTGCPVAEGRFGGGLASGSLTFSSALIPTSMAIPW